MLGPDPVLRMTCSEVLQGMGPGQGQLESRGGVGLGGTLRVQLPSPLVSSLGEKSLVPSLGSSPRCPMAPASHRHISRARKLTKVLG